MSNIDPTNWPATDPRSHLWPTGSGRINLLDEVENGNLSIKDNESGEWVK